MCACLDGHLFTVKPAVDKEILREKFANPFFPRLRQFDLLAGMMTGRPMIVAHRGASADAPENTLAAFREAWRQGADAIEGDFRLTRDGAIVCTHDATMERTAGERFEVEASTLAELRRLDVGAWKGTEWRGERIPTMTEVLAVVPRGKRVVLEMKGGPEMLPALGGALQESLLSPEQVTMIAFDERLVRDFKERYPAYRAHWLTELELKDNGSLEPARALLKRTLHACGADGLGAFAHPALTEDWVAGIRGEGFEFHVWTVDDPDWARALAGMGALSLTTNQPGRLRAVFDD